MCSEALCHSPKARIMPRGPLTPAPPQDRASRPSSSSPPRGTHCVLRSSPPHPASRHHASRLPAPSRLPCLETPRLVPPQGLLPFPTPP
ncbi:hypothetical protein KY289_015654 [Solanum tuberosum]|nr:hypothetical protein KY289_015654 [Solanum tuberosum]